jgi:phosphoesterase RecJ-like protein
MFKLQLDSIASVESQRLLDLLLARANPLMNAHSLNVIESDQSKNSGVVIVSHEHPDPDAHGAGLGLMHLCRALGIENVNYVNSSLVHEKYQALPGSQEIANQFKEPHNDSLIIYVDCATESRIGGLDVEAQAFCQSANIDHHISNTFFADINWVNSSASSASEMIGALAYVLCEQYPVYFTREQARACLARMATCLLAGIYGDTGGFSYTCTSQETLMIAAFLCGVGGDLHLASNIGKIISREVYFFRHRKLSEVEFYHNNRTAILTLSLADFENIKGDKEALEGLVEHIRDINGVVVACVAKWIGDRWAISLRCREPYDVNAVATRFGGGGHKLAAAFKYSGADFSVILCKLLEEIESLL